MTIFRCSLLPAFIALLDPGSARAEPQVSANEKLEDCTKFGREGPIAEYQCVGRNNARKERRLEEAYGKAHAFLLERQDTGMQDNRRNPVYLEWAQSAWKDFAEQHCTVLAGASGGSNAWVSRYWLNCYSEELDRRIKFLEQLAAGQLSSG